MLSQAGNNIEAPKCRSSHANRLLMAQIARANLQSGQLSAGLQSATIRVKTLGQRGGELNLKLFSLSVQMQHNRRERSSMRSQQQPISWLATREWGWSCRNRLATKVTSLKQKAKRRDLTHYFSIHPPVWLGLSFCPPACLSSQLSLPLPSSPPAPTLL